MFERYKHHFWLWLLVWSVLGCGGTAPCGNGKITGQEECDDGNPTEGDGCDTNCTLTRCGNGIASGEEECDDGNDIEIDACLGTCRLASCGDSFTQADQEECDDGNNAGGDGCRGDCQGLEVCGDALLDILLNEGCDDGNLLNGDGCRDNCTQELCGDSILDPQEECDDGNLASGDGCDSNCTPSACGNGIASLGEACDDGNTLGGDGCRSDCQGLEACGDGLLDSAQEEECDDGNLDEEDGCNAACQAESCGDGVVQSALGEECEDGNEINGDECDSDCVQRCGDGLSQPILFLSPSLFPVGVKPSSITVGDFNNDGFQDLATADFNSDSASVLLGDGTGNFSLTFSWVMPQYQ